MREVALPYKGYVSRHGTFKVQKLPSEMWGQKPFLNTHANLRARDKYNDADTSNHFGVIRNPVPNRMQNMEA